MLGLYLACAWSMLRSKGADRCFSKWRALVFSPSCLVHSSIRQEDIFSYQWVNNDSRYNRFCKCMASAVSTYMHGNDVASVGSGTKLQSHPNLAGFLTESLFDAHLSCMGSQMRVVCQTSHWSSRFACEIHANDPTVTDILGDLQQKGTCDSQRNIRMKFVGQRNLLTMLVFANEVNDFEFLAVRPQLLRYSFDNEEIRCQQGIRTKRSRVSIIRNRSLYSQPILNKLDQTHGASICFGIEKAVMSFASIIYCGSSDKATTCARRCSQRLIS